MLVVLWGANRSFDFTDEGVYYLCAARPAEVPDRQTTYYVFGHALFALAGHNIAVTRVLVAGLALAATVVFVRGVRRFLAAFAPELQAAGWLDIAATAGTALAFSAAPVAPSYNLLNTMCLLAATGLVLEAASAPSACELTSSYRLWGQLLAAGILLVADFFIKFSTSVALVALLALLFLATSRARARSKAIMGVALAVAGLLGVAGYLLVFQDLATWRKGIEGTLEGLSRHGYIVNEMTRYAHEISIQVAETSSTYESLFAALLIAGGVLFLFRRRPRGQRWLALIAAGAVCLIGYQDAPPDFARSYQYLAVRLHLAALLALGLAAGITLIVRGPQSRPTLPKGAWRVPAVIGLMVLLPLAGSFGTSNDITVNAIHQLAPWLVGMALLLEWLSLGWQARWMRSVGVVFICAVAFCQFFTGYVLIPYRVPGGRLAQTVPTAIGNPATMLRLDPASHDFVDAVRSQLANNGFKTGDDIFAFFNLPGLVFAVGGISPGYPWYFSGGERSLELDAMRANWVPARRRYRAYVILNKNPGAAPPPWAAMYMPFPEDYKLCGPPLSNPLTGERVEVWLEKYR